MKSKPASPKITFRKFALALYLFNLSGNYDQTGSVAPCLASTTRTPRIILSFKVIRRRATLSGAG